METALKQPKCNYRVQEVEFRLRLRGSVRERFKRAALATLKRRTYFRPVAATESIRGEASERKKDTARLSIVQGTDDERTACLASRHSKRLVSLTRS